MTAPFVKPDAFNEHLLKMPDFYVREKFKQWATDAGFVIPAKWGGKVYLFMQRVVVYVLTFHSEQAIAEYPAMKLDRTVLFIQGDTNMGKSHLFIEILKEYLNAFKLRHGKNNNLTQLKELCDNMSSLNSLTDNQEVRTNALNKAAEHCKAGTLMEVTPTSPSHHQPYLLYQDFNYDQSYNAALLSGEQGHWENYKNCTGLP